MTNDSRHSGHLQGEGKHANPVNALRVHVAGLTGIPLALVRKSWDAEPLEQPPLNADWASVGLLSVDSEGTPQIERKPHTNGGLGSSTVRQWQTLSLVVSFFGSNARENADAFAMGLALSQNTTELKRFGLSLRTLTPTAEHAPEWFSGRLLDRWDVRLTLARQTKREYGVRNLASADFEIHTN